MGRKCGGIMSDMIEIELLNFEQYIGNSTAKSLPFFKVPVELMDGARYADLSGADTLVLLSLITLATQFRQSSYKVPTSAIRRISKLRTSVIHSSLIRLEQFQLVKCPKPPPIIRRRENKKKNNDNKIATAEQSVEAIQTSLVPVAVASDAVPDGLTSRIWNKYHDTYLARYGHEPLRNVRTNSLIKQLAQRLGEEAIEVVEFYVHHPKTYYVGQMHELGPCVKDAEALRIQWLKGKAVTNADLRRFEKQVEHADLDRAIEEGKV
jgi:hypothetical protein